MIYLFYDKNSKAKPKSRKISASEKKKSESECKHICMNRQNTSYARRKALSLEVNADILVAFFMSVLSELKNLGPWKLTENFLTFVLQ